MKTPVHIGVQVHDQNVQFLRLGQFLSNYKVHASYVA